jgi:hypothetical protein
MKDRALPEEKLLRLIKNKAPASQGAAATESKAKIPIRNLMPKHLPYFNTRKILLAIFILSCIYLAASLAYPLFGFKKITAINEIPEKTGEKQEAKKDLKPLEYYSQPLAGSSMFNNAGTSQPAIAANVDLLKDITLVGIITGANPQAVIEDKKSLKNYYVTKGQFIGQMQVEDIQEGKIIINYKGQKYELYL